MCVQPSASAYIIKLLINLLNIHCNQLAPLLLQHWMELYTEGDCSLNCTPTFTLHVGHLGESIPPVVHSFLLPLLCGSWYMGNECNDDQYS